jgi:hypothetical protein
MFLTGEEQVRLSQDGGERIVDLVRDARRQLAHRGQLLGPDELRLGELQLLELSTRFRVEARVVQGDPDLVGRRFHEGDLGLVERLPVPAAERQRAQDAPAAVDRHADEGADPVAPHDGLRRRQEVRGLHDVGVIERLPVAATRAIRPISPISSTWLSSRIRGDRPRSPMRCIVLPSATGDGGSRSRGR